MKYLNPKYWLEMWLLVTPIFTSQLSTAKGKTIYENEDTKYEQYNNMGNLTNITTKMPEFWLLNTKNFTNSNIYVYLYIVLLQLVCITYYNLYTYCTKYFLKIP